MSVFDVVVSRDGDVFVCWAGPGQYSCEDFADSRESVPPATVVLLSRAVVNLRTRLIFEHDWTVTYGYLLSPII